MYRRLKISGVCLALVTLFTVNSIGTVSAETQTKVIAGSSQGAIFWRQITTDVTARVVPVTESQALHTKGYATTIGVSSSKTNSVSASVNVTAGVDIVFTSFSTSMGVSSTQSYTTGSSVSYSIAASTATGRYRIEHVYPCVQVKQQKVLSDTKAVTIQWQRIIDYAPKVSASYRQLNRYAN